MTESRYTLVCHYEGYDTDSCGDYPTVHECRVEISRYLQLYASAPQQWRELTGAAIYDRQKGVVTHLFGDASLAMFCPECAKISHPMVFTDLPHGRDGRSYHQVRRWYE